MEYLEFLKGLHEAVRPRAYLEIGLRHGDSLALADCPSLGVDPASAKDRVAAMTDPEVRSLADRIQSMPAGADSAGTILLLVVIGFAVWWIWFRR